MSVHNCTVAHHAYTVLKSFIPNVILLNKIGGKPTVNVLYKKTFSKSAGDNEASEIEEKSFRYLPKLQFFLVQIFEN